MYRFCLIKNNYLVFITNNGDNRLNQIFYIKPDLMILYLSLPEMNGFEVSKKIKRIYFLLKMLLYYFYQQSY